MTNDAYDDDDDEPTTLFVVVVVVVVVTAVAVAVAVFPIPIQRPTIAASMTTIVHLPSVRRGQPSQTGKISLSLRSLNSVMRTAVTAAASPYTPNFLPRTDDDN